MRRLNIGFYGEVYGGGAERVITNLANSAFLSGHTVSVITNYRKKGEYPLLSGIRRYVLEEENKTRKFGRIQKIREIHCICKKESLEVLVAFSEFIGLLSTVGISTKIIISIRNDPKFLYCNNIRNYIAAKILLPFADGCVFQTKEAQSWFLKILQKKSIILPNPVNETFYHVNYEPVAGRIVTCGRLVPQKNQRLLIDAFQIVKNRNPEKNLELHIYGIGPLHDELQHKILDLKLEQTVKLMGRTDQVPEVLRHAELFVMSSDAEGSPNALMEAMAVGVPCISTDCPCGGPKMLLHDSKDQLVPVGNTKALASAIENMLLNKEKQNIVSHEERSSALGFMQDLVISEWLSYIESVL